MQEHSVVGKRLPAIDAIEKATGEGKFTVDIKLPRMLYGKILRSPYPHAKIIHIGTAKAERLDGVRAVITSKDTPMIPTTCYPPPHSVEDDQIFADEKVRYVGDRVAAVAAESEKIAEEALSRIEVEYEELPAVFDPEEGMRPNAPHIHEEAERNIARKPITWEVGDVEKGFKGADYIFEDRYRTQMVSHCCMEPHAVVASFDSSGKLTVWSSTQTPFGMRNMLAQALDMPVSKIRVIKPTHVGGGFGSKLDLILDGACALLSKKTGRPVRMVCSRKEEFYATRVRHAYIIDLKTGVTKDGVFVARQARVFVSNGAYTSHGLGVCGHAGNLFGTLYKCPNIKYEGYVVYTNLITGGAFRGFGNPQISFAIESQIDTIAEKLGTDPKEFRLKNPIKAGEVTAAKWVMTSSGIRECIEKGAERINWEKKRTTSRGVSGKKKRGLGMAAGLHVQGFRLGTDTASAFVKFNEDGTVNLITGASDTGQGLHTILAQIVAEDLGIAAGDVSVVAGDTDSTPMGYGNYASKSTFIDGNAVRIAVADAKRQLLEQASDMLEASSEDLLLKDGKIFVKGAPEKAISVSDAVVTAQYSNSSKVGTILGRGSYDAINTEPPEIDTWRGNYSCGNPFMAQFAEVEVDTETGEVEVLKIVAAHDLGKAINPMAAEGQIEGGIHMGTGYALSEELIYDRKGQPINCSFVDYKMNRVSDMPKIECILVEEEDPFGPFGAKGVAEPVLVPTAAAISNAIYNAVGVRIKNLPITPEKVLKALREKQEHER
jgi:xanthine dehydrogenase molybdenum-binding subunit